MLDAKLFYKVLWSRPNMGKSEIQSTKLVAENLAVFFLNFPNNFKWMSLLSFSPEKMKLQEV